MMRPISIPINRGVDFRSGKSPGRGFLLRGKNCRYLPGDKADRLWALLGRSKFNSSPVSNDDSGPDTATCKTIFPFYEEGGTPKICMHKGGGIYEADLGGSGAFSMVEDFCRSGTTPRCRPGFYLDSVYYPVGTFDLGVTPGLARDTNGWRKAGFKKPTYAGASAVATGSGTFSSTTQVKYVLRAYDNVLDIESLHGAEITVNAFSNVDHVLLTLTNGFTKGYDNGTHMRIYRTLLSLEPGVYYRVDGSGDGIALTGVGNGYTYEDSLSNADAILYGTVRADGIEGEAAWAEHGGPFPYAEGCIEFKHHLVCFRIGDRENELIYSAQGYPECFPVDWDGEYVYYLPITGKRQDIIMGCARAGDYLVVFLRSSIYRLSHLPTYANPGFDRRIQEEVTVEHGLCGKEAYDSFGIGPDDNQLILFVSSEHGPMVTNGILTRPIMAQADWLNLVEPAYMDQIEVKDYPRLQEVWVAYTPKGGTANTKVLILDYSKVTDASGFGFRVTGPVDAQITAMAYGKGSDDVERLYILDSDERTVFVQDSGSTDAQLNTNASGHLDIEIETPRVFPSGRIGKSMIRRAMISGVSGTERQFSVEHRFTDGMREDVRYDTVLIGPGEFEDIAMINATGLGHRTALLYEGETGSSYDESETSCAPGVSGITLEADAAGSARRTKGT